MRRWNGWGDDGVSVALPAAALRRLERLVGPGIEPRDAELVDVVRAVPPGRLPAHPAVDPEPEGRVRLSRGQSLPDWIALRSGRPGLLADGVARPRDDREVRSILGYAADVGAAVVPHGGGTGVVGGLGPFDPGQPTLLVSLERMADLIRLDEASGLATFGAGATGPIVEGALGARHLTLGHFPQSWELSTVGGWVVTRSVGQQSLGFGRIDALFAGGRLEAPAGTLDLPPHPASAAGPDLRQVVLGSEGRLGILTQAVVRATSRPEREIVIGAFLPDPTHGLAAVRELARARLPTSMIRLSGPAETATTLGLASDRRGVALLGRYLSLRRLGRSRCLLLVALTGRRRAVETAHGEVRAIVRAHRGVAAPGAVGRSWLAERFRTPYLRNALWTAGYAVDTIETAATWDRLPALARELPRALREALVEEDERAYAFSHLSSPYPSGSSLYTTVVFRIDADPDLTLGRWRRLQAAAGRVIVEHGATISHQHGVGADHLAWLEAEKGGLGVSALRDLARRFDPDGRMNPGRLVPGSDGDVADPPLSRTTRP